MGIIILISATNMGLLVLDLFEQSNGDPEDHVSRVRWRVLLNRKLMQQEHNLALLTSRGMNQPNVPKMNAYMCINRILVPTEFSNKCMMSE